MAYFDPAGREVIYSDAYQNGRLKPGYRSTLGNGESLSFDISLMDSAGGRTFLTDGAAQVGAEHIQLFQMMGRDVISPHPRVQGILDRVAQESAERRSLDAACVATSVALYGRSSTAPIEDADKLASSKAVRDAARLASYS